MKILNRLLIPAILATFTPQAWAGPLQQAAVNQIVNDVKVIDPSKGARPAALREIIHDDLAVRTGIQSRTELLFQDDTLTRLGAETIFSFKAGTRDLTLDRGTMLLQVPKNHGGARIRTASVTASITGTTIMMELLPEKSLKVVVLEGSLRLSPNGRLGESINLTAGRMIIMDPNAKRIPEPVKVDLRKLVNTSSLINPVAFKGSSKATVAALPSIPLIEKEIALQDKLVKGSELAGTNLVIAGSGTQVVIASEEKLAMLDKGIVFDKGTVTTANGQIDSPIPTRLPVVKDVTPVPSEPLPVADAKLITPTAAVPDVDGTAIVRNPVADGTTFSLVEIQPIVLTDPQPTTTGTGTGTGTGIASPSPGALKLNAATGITFTKSPSNATIEVTAPILRTSANLSAVGGFLNIGSGGIHAGGSTLSGFDQIDVTGNLEAGSVNVNNALNVGGTFTTTASNAAATLAADSMVIAGGIDLTAANAAPATPAGGTVTINATDVNVAATGINGIKADGADGLRGLIGGGSGGTVNIGTSATPITNSITVDEPISATTGANGTRVVAGGNGGSVNLVANGDITVNSTVKVSDSALVRASRKGGSIKLDSRKTSGTAISINNSGQLLSLLNAASTGNGGRIQFTSSGGDILVNGGAVQADRGTVDIRNNGVGNVALNNANIRGDVVKVGALGANGQLLIGGGAISADTTLNLYGGSSNGQVRFTGDVTLGGNGVKNIAGKTVTIDDGRTVTVGGTSAARVFTDSPNYSGSGGNGTTTGIFGGKRATTQAFGSRPAF